MDTLLPYFDGKPTTGPLKSNKLKNQPSYFCACKMATYHEPVVALWAPAAGVAGSSVLVPVHILGSLPRQHVIRFYFLVTCH